MNIESFDISAFKIDELEISSTAIGYFFQKFCYDILCSNCNTILPLDEHELILYPPKVKDGGIDISGYNKDNRKEEIFIQCRLGLNRKGTEWVIQDLINGLQEKLSNETVQEEYKAWESCDSIRKYIVCLGRACNSLQTVIKSKTKIKSMFLELATREKLKHLAQIEVEVLFWNQLAPILEKDAYLFHKWIKSEPEYLTVLKPIEFNQDEIKVAKEFKDYLSGNYLPFLSRKAFKHNLSYQEKKNFYDEDNLIDLLAKQGLKGIIIHGEGGIGKTRLMFEVGMQFLQKGYSVVEVDKRFDDMHSLFNYFRPDGKYLLMFDYIEEQNRFIEIAEWIYKYDKKNIKFIANCRNSYLIEVQHLGSKKRCKLFDIGIQHKTEAKYKEGIINFIVDSIKDVNLKSKLKENDNLRIFLQERPSFAVFIKYICSKKPVIGFDLKENEDFSNWLLRRLKLTLDISITHRDFCRSKKSIFKIFAMLKVDYDAALKLKKLYKDDIDILIDDGWIDEGENGGLSAVHDTVVDTLLVYYLNKVRLDQIVVDEFLNFGLDNGCLNSCIRSFQRLFDQELNKAKKDKIRSYILAFIETIIDLEHDPRTASFIAGFWLKQGNDPALVRPFVESSLQSNMSPNIKAYIIGHWLEKGDDCSLVKIYIPEVLDKNIYYKAGLYIIGFWLGKADDPAFIKPYLKKYSYCKGEIGICSYIYKYWLQKGDDPDIIGEPLNKLLVSDADSLKLGYILTQYFKYGGKLELIEANLIKWLSANNSVSQVILVLGFCLEHLPVSISTGSTLQKLNNIVKELVGKFSHLRVTGNIFGYWIIKGGELDVIQPFIGNWLKYNYDSLQAELIISFWLMKGGNAADVKDFIRLCLAYLISDERVEEDASRLMVNWLRHGDEPGLITEFIVPWFEIHKELLISRLLITNWLEKFNQPFLIKDIVQVWLNKHGDKKESIAVASYWLKKANSINEVQEYIKTCFLQFSHISESNMIIEFWIKQGGRIDLIKPSVANYLLFNWQGSNAKYVVSTWLHATNDFEYIVKIAERIDASDVDNYLVRLLKMNFEDSFKSRILTEIYNLHIDEVNKRSIITKSFEHIFRSLPPDLKKQEIEQYLNLYGDTAEASFFYRKWLESGNEFAVIKNGIKAWLVIHALHIESTFVIGEALLQAEGFEIAKPYALDWLTEFGETNNSSGFIISSWLKGGGDCQEIKKWVIKLDEMGGNDEMSAWRKEIILKSCI